MNPDELREAIEYLDAYLEAMTHDGDNVRSITDPDEQARFADGLALREQCARDLVAHESIRSRTALPTHRDAPNVIRQIDPEAIAASRDSTPLELRDATLKVLESREKDADNLTHVRSVLDTHLNPDDDESVGFETKEWARKLIQRTDKRYVSAFAKYMSGRMDHASPEERAALAVGTNTQGGYLLPTHLDPTIMLTNAGTDNPIRSIARVVTLTEGETWHGVSSAGVSASMDGELAEVSDDSPTLGAPSVTVHQAQAFVQASVAAFADISALSTDVRDMFADAKDRLEGTQFATGGGTGNNVNGLFTAIHAVTTCRVTSTTAATIGEVDLRSTYRTVPVRWRKRGVWLANPLYTMAIKALGTALSYTYSGDLTQPVAPTILGRPQIEWEDAPTTQTTTALDDEVLYGDPMQYLIVDKPGGMAIEFIPHLFNTSNNLPDGRRGWFAWWRFGADALITSAFALLVDKTSA